MKVSGLVVELKVTPAPRAVLTRTGLSYLSSRCGRIPPPNLTLLDITEFAPFSLPATRNR
jgi:hypothetical protein